MRSIIRKVGLVVLTAILVSSVFAASGTAVSAQPVEVWNITWDGSRFDKGCAVATSGDCVYMAGTISSKVTGNVTGYLWNITEDAFLNKYDSDGNFIWNTTWGRGQGTYSANAVATSGDCVYLAGTMMPLLYSNTSSSNFLNKYDRDGNLIWNVTWEQMDYEMGAKVAAISGDGVYLAMASRLACGIADDQV